MCTACIVSIYMYVYQTFRKSGNLGTGFPATWPKWLRETIKVTAKNNKLAARFGVHPSKKY